MDGWNQRIWLSVPHLDGREREYLEEALASNWVSSVGPHLDALEREFGQLTGRYGVAVGSGTAALHLGMRLLGLGPGDEMVTPTLTFAASCNPILYLGARPILIDSERRTWGLDPGLLEDFLARRAEVGRLPKAVTVVHLFGQAADMDAVLEVCGRYELPVLEDAAESLGALHRGRHPGTLGQVGAYSFNGNKIITGSGGGMLVASDPTLVERARHWATQARDPDPLGLRNYVHSELGYNYRLSNVLAGLIRAQLERLEDRVARRRAVFERYRAAFADLPGMEPMPEMRVDPQSRSTRYLSCFLLDPDRVPGGSGALIRVLEQAEIESRPVWRPMHLQPLYRHCETVGGQVAEDLHARGICLPSSSSLTGDDQGRVIDMVRKWVLTTAN